MSESSDDFDEQQIKSRQQKRVRRDDNRGLPRERKFESGSEEEYVVGTTVAATNPNDQNAIRKQ